MNNGTKIGLIGGIIVLMFVLVYFMSGGVGNEPTKPKRKPFVSSNWTAQYQINDKKPLGLYLFNILAKAHIDTSKRMVPVTNPYVLDSISSVDEAKTYMFVGNDFGIKDEEIDSILTDVDENGSTLFLSFDDLTENLFPKLFDRYGFRQDYGEEVNIFMNGRKFNMINLYQNDTVAREWWAFDIVDFEEDHEDLSSFMELTNFVKVKHGKGHVFLHATPNVFFNYQIKRPSGYGYTAEVLNELPKDQDIYLLEIGRLSDNYGNFDTDELTGEDGKEDNSYLQILFKDKHLRRAMLLTLLGVILFVIFRTRRKRPVVPFIPKKKDMTMAFAETITSIYFSKRNPYGLLQVQRKNFFDAMQRYFFVDLYKRDGDKELNVLAEKSNTPVQEITELVNALETKKAASVNDQFIANLAKRKQEFYRKTGIISDEIIEKITVQQFEFRRAMWLPMIFIFVAIGIIIAGMSLLVAGIGVGIIGWPLGVFLLWLGSARLRHPALSVTDDEFIFSTVFGARRRYKRHQILAIDAKESGVIFKLTGSKERIINYRDLSRFDRKQFKRFISKLEPLEL